MEVKSLGIGQDRHNEENPCMLCLINFRHDGSGFMIIVKLYDYDFTFWVIET